MSLFHTLKVLPQYCIPQHFLTSIVFRITRIENNRFKRFLINNFIRLFNVDMSTSVRKSANEFKHFNDFFTRELQDNARPIEYKKDCVSPVDGFISQFGKINNGNLIQAKGKYFSLPSLLARQSDNIDDYHNGDFITLYLSPSNYHRIHMPITGKLVNMVYVPGRLFGVGESTTNTIDNLFGRNERLIIEFESEHGRFVLIMVGAIFVGSMETVWHGQVTPSKERCLQQWDYSESETEQYFNKGQEIARFNMGSTVILLFENEKTSWETNLVLDQTIKMGQALAGLR